MADHEGRTILEVCRDLYVPDEDSLEFMMENRRLIFSYNSRARELIWAIATIPPHADDGCGTIEDVGPEILDVLEAAFRR